MFGLSFAMTKTCLQWQFPYFILFFCDPTWKETLLTVENVSLSAVKRIQPKHLCKHLAFNSNSEIIEGLLAKEFFWWLDKKKLKIKD